ncbi:PAS domain S-box protein [Gramella sp. KN1008]|uniref:PAS domain S-box protein n=1 Tax=Gramella sp. KN1008 TaxID=2529298 RepID=UPI00103A3817|nr:PAS domain S-box protein [Gramella sp. KN1008]TBW27960.1 PAS domain S-box protein [Gramella sp. KN1008]
MSLFEVDLEFQQFRNSGEFYKQVFNSSVLPIIIHDMYFNIIDVNDKAISEFGYSKEEFLKLQIFDLHAESEIRNSLEVLEKMKKKDSLTVNTLFKRKDGSLFSAEATPCKINFKSSAFIHVHLQKIKTQD